MDRRDLLRAVGAGALVSGAAIAAGSLTGCANDPRTVLDPRGDRHTATPSPYADTTAQTHTPDSQPTHPAPPLAAGPIVSLLNRAGFGPAPGDLERVASMGRDAWLAEQLKAPGDEEVSVGLRLLATRIPGHEDNSGESFGLRWQLGRLEVLRGNPYELRDIPQPEVLDQLQRAALLRAVYSKWQLKERLVDFWTNHFNIYARKVFSAETKDNPFRKPAAELMYFLARDQHDVVRKNALGNVKELVRSSMRSAAMAGYLDSQVNRRGVPNENYARELLELHTLGVDGGYTQKDVQETARALTGWRIEEGVLAPLSTLLAARDKRIMIGTLVFDPARHDNGAKTLLGKKIPAGGGEADAERVLEIVLRHPSCGKFLGKKLARYFYGDGPDAVSVADTIADAYRTSDGDISAMVTALFSHPAMLTPPPAIKRPLDFVVSSLRALDAKSDCGRAVQDRLSSMGQPLYQWPMPDGYPDRTASWTGSLLARWNYALALTTDGVGGTAAEIAKTLTDPHTIIERIFGRTADGEPELARLAKTLAAHDGPSHERIALALASPAFQWK